MISLTYLIAVPLAIIALAMVFGYLVPTIKRRRVLNSPIAIAPFGRGRAVVIPPRPVREEAPAASPQAQAPAQASNAAREAPVARATVGMDTIAPEARAHRARERELEQEEQARVLKLQVAGDTRPAGGSAHGHQPSAPSPAPSLRLEKAADGTLQFLPGKLEVIEGRDVGQELRFVRTPGPDGQTVTFGRNEGPEYRHVQLQEHTVSRMHARLSLEGKTWSLTNLSRTNPVVVNGLPLGEDSPTVVLRDGDRIEMGEVIFRFRSR